MAIVYRYTDLADNVIKYVGIIRRDNRKLKARVEEHKKSEKFQNHNWKIEYFLVNTIADAEILEGHFIALYDTSRFLNVTKKDWGLCTILRDIDFKWILFEETFYGDKEKILRKKENPLTIKEIDTLLYNIKNSVGLTPHQLKYQKKEKIDRNLQAVTSLLNGEKLKEVSEKLNVDTRTIENMLKVHFKDRDITPKDLTFSKEAYRVYLNIPNHLIEYVG